MSGSETRDIVATAEGSDPLELLRDALTEVFAGLVAAGAGPHLMTGLSFETADPAALHPSRHAVDLAYREVFAGFRPPIRLVAIDRAGLTVRARYRVPAGPPSAEPVFAGYGLADLGRQYSPRLQTDMRALFRRWSHDGAMFRAAHGGLDLAYGSDRFETLDLFRPAGARPAPVWVFVHGGYWQASDKAQHVQFARGMLAAGFAVAMPNYGLAPEVPLEASAAQISASLRFLAAEAGALGLDAGRIHLAGHSAGAHLAAMAALDREAPPIRSVLLLSGLFDLAPLGLLPMGRMLGLDDAERARRLSPLAAAPPGLPSATALGGRESDEFLRQSRAIAAHWGGPEPLVVADAHHFSLLEGLHGGPLLDLALGLAGTP